MDEETAVIAPPPPRRERASARRLRGADAPRPVVADEAPPVRPRGTQRLTSPTARSWWLWIGVVAAVLAGVAVVVTSLLAVRAQPAGDIAGGAAVGADAAFSELAATIESASALAAETPIERLADPPARTQLLGAISDARFALSGTAAEAQAAQGDLENAMDRVTRSRSAKALADARTQLAAVLGTAAEVHEDTAGRVADATLLAELEARIAAGRALLASAGAPIDEITGQAQAITDQTAAVLAARLLGFRAAEGTWCRGGLAGASCITIAWPEATLAGGQTVDLEGGDDAVRGSGCYETAEFGRGSDKGRLLYCPAGEAVPDERKVSPFDAGDEARERLWWSSGGRLTDLRYRD